MSGAAARRRRTRKEKVAARVQNATRWAEEAEYGIRIDTIRSRVRLTWDVDSDSAMGLIACKRFQAIVEDYELELVAELRVMRFTWAEVGQMVGLTEDAARKRYTRAVARAAQMEQQDALEDATGWQSL